jgi:hypothetical protein
MAILYATHSSQSRLLYQDHSIMDQNTAPVFHPWPLASSLEACAYFIRWRPQTGSRASTLTPRYRLPPAFHIQSVNALTRRAEQSQNLAGLTELNQYLRRPSRKFASYLYRPICSLITRPDDQADKSKRCESPKAHIDALLTMRKCDILAPLVLRSYH